MEIMNEEVLAIGMAAHDVKPSIASPSVLLRASRLLVDATEAISHGVLKSADHVRGAIQAFHEGVLVVARGASTGVEIFYWRRYAGIAVTMLHTHVGVSIHTAVADLLLVWLSLRERRSRLVHVKTFSWHHRVIVIVCGNFMSCVHLLLLIHQEFILSRLLIDQQLVL